MPAPARPEHPQGESRGGRKIPAAARELGLALAFVLALAAGRAGADEVAWPPGPEARAKIAALQAKISDPAASPEERKAARDALLKLLRSPQAPAEDSAKPREPRAAVTEPTVLLPAGTARDPLAAPAPPAKPETPYPGAVLTPRPPAFIDPQTGKTLIPSGQVAIDPSTGRALPQAPGGYVDPAAGRVVRPR